MNAPISPHQGPPVTSDPRFFVEQSQWCSDLASWQKDQEDAVVQLKQLSETLEQHGRLLNARMEEIEDPDPLRGSRSVQRGRQHRVERRHRVLMAHLAMMKSVMETLG